MKNLEIAALNDCLVWFYGMAFQKEVLFFKLEVHSLDCFSPFFFILLPCLPPFHLSPSFLLWENSPWEKIPNSLFFICHIDFIVLCLFAFDSMFVAF